MANPASTWSVLGRIWRHLSRRRRWQLPGLAVLMLVSGLAEALTLGAVLPFLGVIVAPERVFQYPMAARLAAILGITTSEQLVLPLTLTFALTALGAGAMKLWVLWCNYGYVQRVSHELAVAVYRRTLYQPYPVHIARNTSEMISAVGKIESVTAALVQALTLVSAIVTAGAIMLTLVAIEPLVAATTFLGFGGLYGALIYVTRQRLVHNSRLISRKQTLRIKALQEGLGSIRDVLLGNSQPFYCQIYQQADWPLRQARASNAFMTASPRYVMESVGMVLIAAIAYGLRQEPGGGAAALPMLGALAVGAQRLLPALQQMFSAWAWIRGDQRSAEDVLDLLDQSVPAIALQPAPPALEWQSAIAFAGVSFRYGEDGPWVLTEVSFKIAKGMRVGLVGTTGSGKSTTVDLLMGLLTPTQGEVWVDGMPLVGEYCRAWQQAIAHVPQHIYLADTTIAENIALGVPKAAIDLVRVQQAAAQAQIAAFIEELPEGYWAELGERGIRLSGGQRQRVGIARALYRRASVLVFDEATSALDNATEKSVMGAINQLGGDLTVILIAHRLSTVQDCDLIIEFERGRVVAQGTYEELLARSASFQRLATR
ncbi:ABC transporter ATP-binding protein [Trichothermofontia sp.]